MLLRPPLRPITLFAATYLAALLAFVVLASLADLQRLRDGKMAEASRLSVLMAERFDRSATAADLILQQIQATAEAALAADGSFASVRWQELGNAARSLPEPGTLWIMDAAGELRVTSTTPEAPSINFADREYFPLHQDGKPSHLGAVVRGRVVDQYHWLVSRRINGPDGSFGGVVLAALEDSGLAALHDGVDLGPGSVMAVRRSDGALIMRHPMVPELVGHTLAGDPTFLAAVTSDAESGVQVGPWPVMPGTQIVAWHRTPHHPMVASVLLPQRVLLDLWWPTAMAYAAAFLAALVPLFFLVRLGVRSARAEAAARQSLEALARQQARLLDDQAQVMERQRLFLNTVSHEFRTPLAIIDSTVQVLARQSAETAPATLAKFDKIRRATQRLTGLLETCLAVDRAADTPPNPEPVWLVDVLRPLVAPHGRVQWAQEDRGLTVAGDGPLLGIALNNVLDNALKYSPPQDPVRLTVRRDGGHVLVTVEDSGPGIPEADLPRIFDKYYRAGVAEGTKPGLGLGLHIARTIIEQHGGRIEARSREGLGTTMMVMLPALNAPTLPGAPPEKNTAAADH